MPHHANNATAIRWIGNAETGHLELLDQRLLPQQEVWLRIHTAEQAADAIRDMVVRGAPAIGLCAAYGVVLRAQIEPGLRVQIEPALRVHIEPALRADAFEPTFEHLAAARPTAVNLHWAIERLRQRIAASAHTLTLDDIFQEAEAIRHEDIQANQKMGAFGAALLPANARVLTHCNTGALATAGHGTALGVLRTAFAQGKLQHAYASETRPYLQGARLTMWELLKENIPATLITDNMAGYLMQQKKVDAVIVGADRIAANGDTANKIGTYALAVLCRYHGIPFYVAAPRSTVDLHTADGTGIPIEMRSAQEVTTLQGVSIAPANADALHPAFDVTPHALITAIITEEGVVSGNYTQELPKIMADAP